MNLRTISCTEYGEKKKNFIDSFVEKTKRTKKENKSLLSVKMGNPGGWALNWRAFWLLRWQGIGGDCADTVRVRRICTPG